MPNNGHKQPAIIERTRSWAEATGGESGGTHIKQADEAMFPGGDNAVVNLIQKARIDFDIESDMAWLMADAAEDGEIDLSAFALKSTPSVQTTFLISKLAFSYGAAGKARNELVQVLTAVGRPMSRFRGMFGRGGNSYEGGGYEG